MLLLQGCNGPSLILQRVLEGTIRVLAPVIRYVPAMIASWIAHLLKLLFISMLGFTAWVNRFPGQQFYATFSVIALFISSAYACLVSARQEENRAISREWTSWREEFEILRRRRVNGDQNDAPEQDEATKVEEVEILQSKIGTLATRNRELEEAIRLQKDEAVAASNELRRNLDEMEKILSSMQIAERDKGAAESRLHAELEKSDRMRQQIERLHPTVEALEKERENLAVKHSTAMVEIKQLREENNKLRLRLRGQNEENYYSDVRQIAQQLRTSLSSAKGKLSRVGNFLKDDTLVKQQRHQDSRGNLISSYRS